MLRAFIVIVIVVLGVAQPALAGMPSITLTDVARARLQSLSFFLVLFFVSAFIVKLMWNRLAIDFPRLPRLSYGRSTAVVGLWGFLFVLVLTMISGARELLTPGAWERTGLTYKLREDTNDDAVVAAIESQRHARIEALRMALWKYAAAHDGNLPPDDRVDGIDPYLWETPDPSRVRYLYFPGRRADVGRDIVACEPLLFMSPLAITSDGTIKPVTAADIRAATENALARKATP